MSKKEGKNLGTANKGVCSRRLHRRSYLEHLKIGLFALVFVITLAAAINTALATNTWTTDDANANITIGNNNEVFVDNKNDRVGIGTTGPGAKLEVSGGNILIDNNVAYRSKNAAGGGIDILKVDTGNSLVVGGTSLGGIVDIFNGYSTRALRIIGDPGANGVIISSGNVGIGTTAPAVGLHVVGTTGIREESGGYTMSIFGGSRIETTRDTLYLGYSPVPNINFMGGKVYFKSDGNVGIGTTTPANKLEVVGTGYITGATQIDGAVGIGVAPTSAKLTVRAGADANLWVNTDSSELTIQAVNNAGGANVPLRFYATEYNLLTGNVGIGTTSPEFVLDVRGSSASKLQLATSDYVSGSAGSRVRFEFGAATGNTYTKIQTTDVGGISASDLVLQTDSGNVGIGTTTPAQKLDVVGYGKFSSGVIAGDSKFYNSVQLTDSLGGTTQAWMWTPAANQLYLGVGAVGSATKLMMSSSGNVGIGTYSTANKLSVVNDIGILTSSDTVAGIAYLGFYTQANRALGSQILGYSTNTGELAFYTGNAGTLGLYQNYLGNVGIGTTGPTSKLEVVGNIYSSNTKTDTVFSGNQGTGVANFIGSNGYWALRTDTANKFNLDVYNGGSPLAAVTVQQNGNVGIGTTSPAEKLHVVGDVRIDGNLKILKNISNINVQTLVVNGTIRPPAGLGGTFDLGASSLKWRDLYLSGTANAANIKLDNLYDTDGTNFFDNTCTYGVASIDATGALTCAAQQGVGSITGSGVAGRVPVWSGATSINSSESFFWDATNKRLGIGTASPSQSLNVNNGNIQIDSGDLRLYSTVQRNIDMVGGGDLGFKINGTTKMLLQESTGNVGIGTTAPGYKLHVVDTALTNPGTIRIQNTGVGDSRAGFVMVNSDSATTGNVVLSNTDYLNVYTNGAIPVGFGTNNNINDLVIDTSHNVIVNNGNVGIGTTSPNTKLSVAVANAANTPYPIITAQAQASATTFGGLYSVQDVSAVGWGLAFNTYKANVGLYEALRILHNGNVGIGTTNPTAALHIVTTGADGLKIDQANGNNFINFLTSGSSKWVQYLNGNDLRFFDTTSRVTFQAGGNVGIGTTSPTELVHLAQSNSGGDTTLFVSNTAASAANNVARIALGPHSGFVNTNSPYIQAYDESGNAGLAFGVYNSGLSEKVRIDKSGNVGIGTTAPLGKLHITGTADDEQLIVKGYSTQTSNLQEWQDSTGVAKAYVQVSGDVWGSTFTPLNGVVQLGTNGFTNRASSNNGYLNIPTTGAIITRNIGDANPALIVQQVHASSTGNILQLKNSASTLLVVQQGGNVGIGTAAPMAQLEVKSTSSTSALPAFNVSNNTNSEKLIVLNNGNVGIGTTAPGAKLHVKDTNYDVYFGDSQNGLRVANGGEPGLYIDNTNDWLVGTSWSGGNIPGKFYIRDVTAGAFRLVIANGTGNVGIGTTNPGSILDILKTSGNAKIKLVASDGTSDSLIDFEVDSDSYAFGYDKSANAFKISHAAALGTADFMALANSITFSPTAGYNFAVNLATTGDFVVNTNQLYVDTSSGNVGIGTTAPGSKLQVNGLTTLRGSGTLTPSGSNTYGLFLTGAGTSNTDTLFEAKTDAAKVIITNAGNVGIGTTSPNQKLHIVVANAVSENVNDAIRGTVAGAPTFDTEGGHFENTVTGTGTAYGIWAQSTGAGTKNVGGYFVASGATTNYGLIVGGGNVGIGTTAPMSQLEVKSTSAVSLNTAFNVSNNTNSEKLVILNNGNVGIGTASPARALDVVGSGWFGGSLSVDSGIADANYMRAQYFSPYTAGQPIYLKNYAQTTLMTLLDGGNVGIGTTSPAEKLHVVGDVRIDGNLKILKNISNINVQTLVVNGTIRPPAGFGSTFDLGTSGLKWRDLYLSGTANAANIKLDNLYDTDGTNFFDNTCTYGVASIDATGALTCASQQGAGSVTGTGVAGRVPVWSGATSINSSESFFWDATNKRLGIGTTAPAGTLHIASGQILIPDGTASQPSLALASGSTTGFYRQSAGVISITSGGYETARFTANGGLLLINDAANLRMGASADTSLSRLSASKVAIGSGSAGDYSGTLIASNVGIGTTGPVGVLDVRGANSATTGVLIGSTNANVGVGIRLFGSATAGGTSQIYTDPWVTEGPLVLGTYTYRANQLYLATTGNVGIGTTGPGARLDVRGDGSTLTVAQILSGNDSVSSRISVGRSSVSAMFGVSSGGSIFTAGDVAGDLVIRNLANNILFSTDGGATTQMVLKNGGNVGIGYADPGTAKLAINGNVGIGTTAPNSFLTIMGDNTNDDQLVLTSSLTNNVAKWGAIGGVQYNSDTETEGYTIITGVGGNNLNAVGIGGGVNAKNAATLIQFFTVANTSTRSSAGAEKMRINSNGNVGIGTTAPGATLDVEAGNIRLSIGGSERVLLTTSGGSGVIRMEDSSATAKVWIGANSNSYFNGGNVGIGTTAPYSLLDVGGSSLVNANIIPVISMTANTNEIRSLQLQNKYNGTVAEMRFITAANDNSYMAFTQPSTANTGTFFGATRGTGSFIFNSANGGTARDLYLGTYDAKNLNFGTSNLNRMTILSGGNVGIGTTGPTSSLEIYTASGKRGLQVISEAAGYTAYAAIGKDYGAGIGTLDSADPTKNILWVSDGATIDANKHLTSAGNIRFVVNQGGNVGIGTTSPNNMLTLSKNVVGALGPTIRLENQGGNAGAADYIDFGLTGSSTAIVARIGAVRTNAVTAGDSDLFFSTGGDAPTERVRITSSGNVGIGTTAPSTKLQVNGLATIGSDLAGHTEDLLVHSTTANTAIRSFADSASGTSQIQAAAGASGVNTVSMNIMGRGTSATGTLFGVNNADTGQSYVVGGQMLMGTYDNYDIVIGTNNAEKVRILAGGNVGIGTTTPGKQLTVYKSGAESAAYIQSDADQQASLYFGSAAQTAFYRPVNTNDFRIWTGAADRLSILGTSGNVGIGTTAPDAKLHVNGDIKLEAGATDHRIYNDGNNDLVIKSGTGGDVIIMVG